MRCLTELVFGVFGVVGYRLARSAWAERVFACARATDLLGLFLCGPLCVQYSDLLVILLLPLLIIGLETGRGVFARLLSSPVVHWLGTISYSIYLVHGLLFWTVPAALQAALESDGIRHAYTIACTITIVAGFCVASVTYYVIERPAREWSRRLIGGRRPMAIEAEPGGP